ncbi:peptidase S41 [Runella slithyformis]|uniref:Peptidase S41 n=1 Tax=Runella slithyformis (strain ATCC 29530 / DSM 19594 / LMG 11500 / NCIMB 11436 / LSU 4) TaxID=761193 RepID=A0A7U4E7Y6_RUNSL|nr:peptidase S41 [Runella slithyformis]AEI50684.1 peptidase S41 [Runella slithyformis DSM 19594]
MAKKILNTFILALAFSTAFGQYLTKNSLLSDLTYLNEAVQNGHPVNYKDKKTEDIQNVIIEAKKTVSDTLKPFEYTLWIEKAIFNVGCVHTSIKKNPLLLPSSTFSYFPCALKMSNSEIIVKNCTDTLLIGHKILSINKTESSKIIQAFSQYKASDGKSDAFAKQYFQLASTKLIAVLLNNPSVYEIITDKGVFTLPATPKGIFDIEAKSPREYHLINNGNFLSFQNKIPILRFTDFSKSDINFIQKSFRAIADRNSKQLIIDLRQNTGGNRKASIELTRYLADSVFSYSILQPKLKTKSYLDGKGKFFLFLSKLKYNIGNVHKGHKTALGKEFLYRYTPKKKNNFNGQIFVLTDGFTASASTMVTSWLKQFTNANFYGTQAGGGYNGNNGGTFPTLTLPNSKIEVIFPAYRLILDRRSTVSQGIIPEQNSIETNTNYNDIIQIINGVI